MDDGLDTAQNIHSRSCDNVCFFRLAIRYALRRLLVYLDSDRYH